MGDGDVLSMQGVERPLPLLDDDNRAYWEAGQEGVLRFTTCNSCGALLHPPVPVCRYCRSEDLGTRDVSGRGIVVGATVNHHLWDPRFPPPFVIVTVAIEEDPRVRVVSNLLGVTDSDIRVGMCVQARFEHAEDVWIPLFVPLDEPDAPLPDDETPPDDHRRWVRPMVTAEKFEDRVALTGIGMSEVGRRLMRPPLSLTVEAVKAAVEDAGLTLDDIDGLASYPGGGAEAASPRVG